MVILFLFLGFSIFRRFEIDIIYWILKACVVITGFLILYFHMNYYYTQEPFSIGDSLKTEIDVFLSKKANKSNKINSNKSERSVKNDGNRFKQNEETNRFTNY